MNRLPHCHPPPPRGPSAVPPDHKLYSGGSFIYSTAGLLMREVGNNEKEKVKKYRKQEAVKCKQCSGRPTRKEQTEHVLSRVWEQVPKEAPGAPGL